VTFILAFEEFQILGDRKRRPCVSKYNYRADISSTTARKTNSSCTNHTFILIAKALLHGKSGPIAKAVEHLGEAIEVLKLPQSSSLPHLTGSQNRETGRIAEIDASSVGSACWVREICAWRAVRVEGLGIPGHAVVGKRELHAEGRLLLGKHSRYVAIVELGDGVEWLGGEVTVNRGSVGVLATSLLWICMRSRVRIKHGIKLIQARMYK
jgi:hypothetical protein